MFCIKSEDVPIVDDKKTDTMPAISCYHCSYLAIMSCTECNDKNFCRNCITRAHGTSLRQNHTFRAFICDLCSKNDAITFNVHSVVDSVQNLYGMYLCQSCLKFELGERTLDTSESDSESMTVDEENGHAVEMDPYGELSEILERIDHVESVEMDPSGDSSEIMVRTDPAESADMKLPLSVSRSSQQWKAIVKLTKSSSSKALKLEAFTGVADRSARENIKFRNVMNFINQTCRTKPNMFGIGPHHGCHHKKLHFICSKGTKPEYVYWLDERVINFIKSRINP